MKSILNLWWISFCLFASLKGEENPPLQKEESMTVNSGEVEYNGKEIILFGQVVIQHHLGQISAHRLSIQPSFDKKNKFGFLKMNEDVHIEFKGGGELYCQQAEVDYAKMRGIFLGDAKQPDVIYLQIEEKERNQKLKPSVEIKSLQMTLEMMHEPANSSLPAQTLIKQIEADQQVRVHYHQDHLLIADHALYQRLKDHQSSTAGLLTLTVRGNLPACTMTNLNGDRLSAHRIQLTTQERKLWLNQPVGILYMRDEGHPMQTLEFSSHELIWDEPQQTLLLRGQVKMTQNQHFHLQTSHELVISQALINGKRTLQCLRAPQETQISYFDVQKGNTHKIHCPGSLVINHERQEMIFQGRINNAQDQKEESQQVYIEDVLGEMYADQVHVSYIWKDQQLIPEKIILEGHVRLMNRFDGHREESASILHYALADRLECLPKQQEMILSGTNGHRVLFFDKVNNIQMSAPSLKMHRDVTTQKEVIQGLGDVRFTFMEKELEQLKRQLLLQKE